MTRVFVCSACNKTTVVRGKQEDPAVCACGSSALTQAMTGKKPEAPPPRVPAIAAIGNQGAKEKALPPLAFYCQHPKGNGICGTLEPCREHAAHFREKSDGETPLAISAEEYRAEWISERVANAFEQVSVATFGPDDVSNLWTVAAALYDEGKRRELLP